MKFAKLDELHVWNEAVKLAVEIYKTTKSNTDLKKDYGLKEQMQRSAISISSNIAEGFERQTKTEFIRYLFIAKGSCAELKTQLLIAREIGYISHEKYNELKDSCDCISVMLFCLIQYLQHKKKSDG